MVRSGFPTVAWEIEDAFGHQSTGLDSLLERVVWEKSKHFGVNCSGGDNWLAVDTLRFSNSPVTIAWRADRENGPARAQAETLAARIESFLVSLPSAEGPRNLFIDVQSSDRNTSDVSDPELEAEVQTHGRTDPWWDVRRAPRSIIDWLALTLLATLLGGGLLYLVTTQLH